MIATAALFTRMSQRPNSASSCSTIAWYSARLLTSAAAAIAVPPAAVISATTLPAGSGMWLWLITTLAPAAASAAAMALPIPVAAPVTSAVLPASAVLRWPVLLRVRSCCTSGRLRGAGRVQKTPSGVGEQRHHHVLHERDHDDHRDQRPRAGSAASRGLRR